MAIPALNPTCTCDQVSHSEYGVILNDESVVRVLTDHHYKGVKIRTSAFSLSDIIERGVSLVRLDKVDVIEFQNVGEDIRLAASAGAVMGALAVRASKIRSLFWPDGTRQLCLFDDPVKDEPELRDNPAHCMALSPAPIDRVQAQEIRDHLLEIFCEVNYLNVLWEMKNP